MPEHDPEQELGPKITSALHHRAAAQGPQAGDLARVARRRVHRRRQAWSAAAAVVLVGAAVGGVWNVMGGDSPTAGGSSEAAGTGDSSSAVRSKPGVAPNGEPVGCPAQHPIQQAEALNDVPAGTGLEVTTPVTGLQVCRYAAAPGGLLGQEQFPAATAQQVVDAIKVLPERNPDLPVFKCAPQVSKPAEAIVLRFTTAAGIREIWVAYDGCASAGFFTGTHTYGLYTAPLKLFMKDSVRPAGGTYLDALGDW